MEKYKHIGFKLTPQRIAILDYLEGNRTHPSAEDIFAAVSKKFPTMSFATVYNTVEALRQKGRVSELSIDPVKKRFDPDTDPHHHMICTKCKTIVDIHLDYELILSENDSKGFKITGNHIEFYGICPDCKDKEVTSNGFN